jgi:DNA-binding GntR family transcriptional regulator
MATGTAKERTITLLREAILDREFRSGEPLYQEQLAARFGVSLTPLREALAHLETEGLLVIYPNRGTFVAPLSPDEVLETFELRYFVEASALKAAIPVMNEKDLIDAKALVKPENFSDGANAVRSGLAFHYALCRPCGRALTLRMLHMLHKTSERYLRIFYAASTSQYINSSLLEHDAILELCRKKDIEKVLEVLYLQLSSTFHTLAAYFRTGGASHFDRPDIFQNTTRE